MAHRKAKVRGVIVGAAVAALTTAGIGVALWTANGSGEVATRAGSLTAVIVVAPTNPGGALLPGGIENAYADLTNNNNETVQLVDLTQTGRATSPNAGCDAALTLAQVTFFDDALPIDVAPGSTSGVTVGTVQASSSFANACQSQVIRVPVSTQTTIGT